MISNVSPEHNIFLFFTGLNNEDTHIFGMACLQKSWLTLNNKFWLKIILKYLPATTIVFAITFKQFSKYNKAKGTF
jgi:hypothetical protein